ncbi:STAS domain-containing protein [Mesobacillus foraminis]|uniref:STAS domain-containing protein n=1 Tax=Mesobacillus foraminis TaxID=279826 RepID=UPI001BE843E1|nr:STAS domain-containing protein [Mesobacillus foraminis]MBT2756817.1 STAS domain-containing protein [Mesobacillus foraminis]
MSSIIDLIDHLNDTSHHLAQKIVEGVLIKMKLIISDQEKEAAISMYETLMGFLGEVLKYGTKGAPKELIEWSKVNAMAQVSSGSKISEIVVRYPPTKEVFADLVLEWSSEFNLKTDEAIWILRKMNEMLDISLEETVLAFEQLNDQIRNVMQKELEVLSAPIVPVKEGVIVLPFIGNIDSNRTKHILENVVPKISELQINYLIADFSGVRSIDEEMFHNLHQIGLVLRLLGIQVITTGISPVFAQSAVQCGIDFSNITSLATVKQALEILN